MIWLVLLAAKAAAAPAPAVPPVDPSIVAEAAHALQAGRLDQARLMIARAVGAGMSGEPVQKVIADVSFASGEYDDALNQYKRLAAAGDQEQPVCENGMISALKLGRLSDAKPFANCATPPRGATWRAWNARGVIADMSQDWDTAAQFYSRAHQLAPKSAEVANNQGWSLVLRGDWAASLPYFELAASLDSSSQRIADNLELARTALDAALPARREGETNQDWAARLNDAGVAAQLLGDKQRAIAAFTQALYASDHWYARAANNLDNVARP
jgi:tetratricopeptide (TPR) repeat protein